MTRGTPSSRTTICIVDVQDGEDRYKEAERIFKEIMVENFPNFMKDVNINIQEASQTPSKMNSKRHVPRHVIIRLSKDKEQILEAAQDKQIITYSRSSIRKFADSLSEILEARRQWASVCNVLKGFLYVAKLSFKSEEEIKTFPNKQKMREFLSTRPTLQKCSRVSCRLK